MAQICNVIPPVDGVGDIGMTSSVGTINNQSKSAGQIGLIFFSLNITQNVAAWSDLAVMDIEPLIGTPLMAYNIVSGSINPLDGYLVITGNKIQCTRALTSNDFLMVWGTTIIP